MTCRQSPFVGGSIFYHITLFFPCTTDYQKKSYTQTNFSEIADAINNQLSLSQLQDITVDNYLVTVIEVAAFDNRFPPARERRRENGYKIMKTINLGLIGFGTIGTGVVKLLQESTDLIRKRLGANVSLKKIADLDITTPRQIDVEASILTTDTKEITDDPEISIVIELIGGYEPARSFILEAIRKKKHVITANKALLATHGNEIFRAAEENGVDIAFEASVGGTIPIIKTLKESLVANRIKSIYGIINGTSNYILSKMTDEGKSFESVLKEAQKLGFAETDPTFDIEGIDTAHKLAIIL